jgi:type IV pilus assembly protein PilM
MGLTFLNSGARKRRNHMMSVDLGSRITKAVLLERRGEGFALTRYALLDAPIFEKTFNPESLGEHLKVVSKALGDKTKLTTLSVGVDDAIVRMVELPQIPVDEMRQVLKNNTRGYLQQDLPDRVFDCHVIPSKPSPLRPADAVKTAAIPKLKVLVAGAKKESIKDFQVAIRNAGLIPDCIVPSLISPINAFEMAMPEAYAKESVALVDIGFKNSSICILNQGELVLNRVVGIGGDKLTTGLAETMNISYAEAEGIKISMTAEAQSALATQILPLCRELRASLDFFEHEQDRPVSRVYVSGGSASSEFILQTLHSELAVECGAWDPTTFLQMALHRQQAVEIKQIAPQLTVAIGAAMAAF